MHVSNLTQEFWDNHAYVRFRAPKRILTEPREILAENRIFMGNIRSQDDIFEGHPRIERPEFRDREDLVNLAIRMMPGAATEQINAAVQEMESRLSNPERREAVFQELSHRVEKLYSGSSILSFGRRITNQRGWKEYADFGQGYAYVFDFRVPWKVRMMDGLHPSGMVPFPVRYVDPAAMPSIRISIGPQDPEGAWRDIERALLMKSNTWADQEEARLIRVGIGEGHVSFPSQSLRALVFGYQISVDDERFLQQLCRDHRPDIPIYRVVPVHIDHRLELQQVA